MDDLLSTQKLFYALLWWPAGRKYRDRVPPSLHFTRNIDATAAAALSIHEIWTHSICALDIQVKGHTIRIAGAKSVDYGEKASLHRRERLAGRFDRAVTSPVEIDDVQVKAEYRDSILALFLPRAERDKPRSIKPN